MATAFKDAAALRAYVAKNVQPPAAAGLKAHAELDAKLAPELRRLTAAVDQEEVELARVLSRTLPTPLGRAEEALARLEEAGAAIDVATDAGAAFPTELGMLTTLAGRIGTAKKAIAGWIRDGNAQIARAAKLGQSAAAVEQKALAAWTRFMQLARPECAAAVQAVPAAKALHKQAKDALMRRDAAALKQLQAQAARTCEGYQRSVMGKLRGTLETFAKNYDGSMLGPGFLAQYRRDRDEIAAQIRRGIDAEDQAVTLLLDIGDFSIDPPDAARAIKVLGLKPAQAGELKKAFAGSESALLRTLDALARDAGIQLPAKDMLAKLRREKVL